MTEQLRQHLKLVAEEWHTKPSGYVIQQRKAKLDRLLNLTYKTSRVEELADEQLQPFLTDLDNLMYGEK